MNRWGTKFNSLAKVERLLGLLVFISAILFSTLPAQATFQTAGIPAPGATAPFGINDIQFIDIADDVQLPSGQLKLGDQSNAASLDPNAPNNANVVTISNDGTNVLINQSGTGGNLLFNGTSFLQGTLDTASNPNTVALRDASGNLVGETITADTGFSGTILTAAQPNITSLGTLTGLNVGTATPMQVGATGVLTMQVGGVAIQMGNARIGGLADAVANDEAVNLGQMNTAISNAVSSLSMASSGASIFLGAFEISVPAAAGTATQSFDSSTDAAFPANSLDNSTILRSEIVNFTPTIHISDDQGRFGTTIVTGATSPAFVALPGTSNNVEFNADISGAAGNQVLTINVRRAAAASAPFDADFSLTFDVYGIKSQCSDGLDNDGDGQADFGSDAQCASASDNDESA